MDNFRKTDVYHELLEARMLFDQFERSLNRDRTDLIISKGLGRMLEVSGYIADIKQRLQELHITMFPEDKTRGRVI